jgi:formate hydrogenlyase subunit 3/multisubunit Na+/H+ antiporter MnhD subunit
MFAAILLSWFYFNIFIYQNPLSFFVAIISLILLCSLGIMGIFEKKMRSYLLLSNAIQILFVILDLSIVNLLGEFGPLSTIQIFNYVFAGLVFFLSMGIFGRGKQFLYELEGSFFASRWNDVFASIACLSLAGLPAFNMFVSEWLLFTKSFTVAPMITVLGVFTALILFIMYYKVIYFLLTGKTRKKHIPFQITLLNGTLAVICLLLGILPHLQLKILSMLIVLKKEERKTKSIC